MPAAIAPAESVRGGTTWLHCPQRVLVKEETKHCLF